MSPLRKWCLCSYCHFCREIRGLTCLSWKCGPVLCLSLFFYSMALNTLLNKNLALLNISHSKITLLLCMIRRLTSSIFEKEICIRDDMENSCQLCDISYSCNHFSKSLSFERTSAKLLLNSSSNKIIDSLRNCLTHYSAGGGQRVLLLRATTWRILGASGVPGGAGPLLQRALGLRGPREMLACTDLPAGTEEAM